MKLLILFLPLLVGLSCSKNFHPTQLIELKELSQAIPAMESTFAIKIWSDDPAKSEIILDAVIEEVKTLNVLFDSKNSDSEARFLISHSGKGPIELSEAFFEYMYFSVDLCQRTHQFMDITVGPWSKLWGFTQPIRGETKSIPSEEAINAVKPFVGCQNLLIDKKRKSIETPSKVEFDFAPTARGYVLDRAAAVLEEYNVVSAEMSLGKLVYFYGKAPQGGKWSMSVSHPRDTLKTIAKFEFDEGIVAVLSDAEKYFMFEGRRYPYVIDPQTGWPVRDMSLVAVWAPTAIEASAWSYAAFVTGAENGKKLISAEKKIAALWLTLIDPNAATKEQLVIQESPQVKITETP